MRIRFLLSYPYFMDRGGGARVSRKIAEGLGERFEVAPLDLSALQLDFDVLLVFGCSRHPVDLLDWLSERGVRIVIFPIYDRVRPRALLRASAAFGERILANETSRRKRVLHAAHRLVCANETESFDMRSIYGVPSERIRVIHHGVSDELLALAEGPVESFEENHPGWKDFVFLPAAQISRRKGQIELLDALTGTGIGVVMNNTHRIEDGLERRFAEAAERNGRVLRLEELSISELASAYRGAKVSVSLSRSETAGLVNLEALSFGCNLVVSDLPAFREYLGPHATFLSNRSPAAIRDAIREALAAPRPGRPAREWIDGRYRWRVVVEAIAGVIREVAPS